MALISTELKHRLAGHLGLCRTLAAYIHHRRVRARLAWAWRKFTRIPAVELTRRTWQELGPDHATDMAASVGFHALLSLFPLVIVLMGLFSMVMDPESVERGALWFFHAYLPGADDILQVNVAVVGNIQSSLGVISFLGLIWTSSMLFGAISRAVNRAWDVDDDPPIYIDKPRQIIMFMGLAPLLLLSIFATTALQFPGQIDLPLVDRFTSLENNAVNILTRLLSFVFSLGIFLLIYKYTPDTFTRWRYIWPGALLASVMFEIAKTLFVLYLDNFANHERVYGSLASVIALMGWVYLSGLILIIGAEFASEYERMRLGVKRGRLVARRLYPKTKSRRKS